MQLQHQKNTYSSFIRLCFVLVFFISIAGLCYSCFIYHKYYRFADHRYSHNNDHASDMVDKVRKSKHFLEQNKQFVEKEFQFAGGSLSEGSAMKSFTEGPPPEKSFEEDPNFFVIQPQQQQQQPTISAAALAHQIANESSVVEMNNFFPSAEAASEAIGVVPYAAAAVATESREDNTIKKSIYPEELSYAQTKLITDLSDLYLIAYQNRAIKKYKENRAFVISMISFFCVIILFFIFLMIAAASVSTSSLTS